MQVVLGATHACHPHDLQYTLRQVDVGTRFGTSPWWRSLKGAPILRQASGAAQTTVRCYFPQFVWAS
jgi:hypothetical protein